MDVNEQLQEIRSLRIMEAIETLLLEPDSYNIMYQGKYIVGYKLYLYDEEVKEQSFFQLLDDTQPQGTRIEEVYPLMDNGLVKYSDFSIFVKQDCIFKTLVNL